MTATTGWLPLNEIGQNDTQLAGGKAARLGELTRHGFQIPDGFVLTTQLFGDSGAAAQAISEALPSLGLGTQVAVRSSAIAEDLAQASFAGQYETVLGVIGKDQVLAAVERCWASAKTERVTTYARERGGGQVGHVAILVQRMVKADAAGVAYSANPVTGDREEAVVSAVRGLGERLVSGEAAPDEWIVRGEVALCTRRSEASIDAAQASRIAQLACTAADRLGAPQDIDWALAGDELYLLQSRPITGLPETVDWKSPLPGGFMRHFRFGRMAWRSRHAPFRELAPRANRERALRRISPHRWSTRAASLPRRRQRLVLLLDELSPHASHRNVKDAGRLHSQARYSTPQGSASVAVAVRLNLESNIKEWRAAQPRYREASRQASSRVEHANREELVDIIERLARDAGKYFVLLMGVSGCAAKAELPLAALYAKHLQPRIGGSYMDSMQGLRRLLRWTPTALVASPSTSSRLSISAALKRCRMPPNTRDHSRAPRSVFARTKAALLRSARLWPRLRTFRDRRWRVGEHAG